MVGAPVGSGGVRLVELHVDDVQRLYEGINGTHRMIFRVYSSMLEVVATRSGCEAVL